MILASGLSNSLLNVLLGRIGIGRAPLGLVGLNFGKSFGSFLLNLFSGISADLVKFFFCLASMTFLTASCPTPTGVVALAIGPSISLA